MSFSCFKNILKEIKGVLEVLSSIALIIGAVAGVWALIEYSNSNMCNAEAIMVGMEDKAYEKVFNKSYLQAMFAQMPTDVDPFTGSHEILKLYLSPKENNMSFTWKDIPDLYNKLFQYEGFNNPDRVKLRYGYFLAENFLYLLDNSFVAHEYHLESDDDLETWFAYLDDIGQHPLFLRAIYCGHKFGYIEPEFASFIVERMKKSRKSEQFKAILKSVYPDMLSDEWARQTGQYK